jgi:hypothetical protein
LVDWRRGKLQTNENEIKCSKMFVAMCNLNFTNIISDPTFTCNVFAQGLDTVNPNGSIVVGDVGKSWKLILAVLMTRL